jgi:hypothetical protein
MDHPFFKTIEWTSVDKRIVVPPFVPKVLSQFDLRNFDEVPASTFQQIFTTESVTDSLVPSEDDLKHFQSFSYQKNLDNDQIFKYSNM